jgi:hypothetical protein
VCRQLSLDRARPKNPPSPLLERDPLFLTLYRRALHRPEAKEFPQEHKESYTIKGAPTEDARELYRDHQQHNNNHHTRTKLQEEDTQKRKRYKTSKPTHADEHDHHGMDTRSPAHHRCRCKGQSRTSTHQQARAIG